MDWFEDEVRNLERTREQYPLNSPVVFYGSSSIRFWNSLDLDFPMVESANLGFGGSTLQACAHFFQRLVVPSRPKSIILYAGDNDLGDGRSPDQVHESLIDLLRQMDESLGAIPFGFISVKPSPARWYIDDRIRSVNEKAKAEMEKRSNSYFIDIYPAMIGQDGTPIRSFYMFDSLHLSREGYRVWAAAVEQYAKFLF